MAMKICDICGKAVNRLGVGLAELDPLDVCEICSHDLHQRLILMERRVVGFRQQQRAETLAAWRRERAAKP